MSVRVRFAPSPTGFLHIGGARTALFNWLFARHEGGEFLLRIEDTDRQRHDEDSVGQILRDMEWLGLDWDAEPEYQSRRGDLYRAALERLIDAGAVYRCRCTPEDMEPLRAEARAENRKVHNPCRDLEAPDEPGSFAWRFRGPMEGETVFFDQVRGEVRWQNAIIDDLVVARSDGSPTYNFCVVVDDADMAITHVIRGEDHISNTPRQVQIYEALGLTPPVFAHLPLVKGLSKRKGSAAVGVYREQGYLPSAVVNFLARMGWSHGDQEIFSIAQLVEHFTLEGVGKASGEYNESKLEWTNAQHIQGADPQALIPHLGPFLPNVPADHPRLPVAIGQLLERAKTLADFGDKGRCYFERVEPDAKAVKQLAKADPQVLPAVVTALQTVTPWDEPTLEQAYRDVAETLDIGLGKVAQPVRAALTGTTAHVGIWEFTSVMDRDEVLERLAIAAAG